MSCRVSRGFYIEYSTKKSGHPAWQSWTALAAQMCLPIFEVPTCVGQDTLSYIKYQYHYEFVVLSITTILAF